VATHVDAKPHEEDASLVIQATSLVKHETGYPVTRQ
jgi:hypothetical protein